MRTGDTMARTRSLPETVVSPEQQGRVTAGRSLARPTRIIRGPAVPGLGTAGGASAGGGSGAGATGAGAGTGTGLGAFGDVGDIGGGAAGREGPGRAPGRGAVLGLAGWVEPA